MEPHDHQHYNYPADYSPNCLDCSAGDRCPAILATERLLESLIYTDIMNMASGKSQVSDTEDKLEHYLNNECRALLTSTDIGKEEIDKILNTFRALHYIANKEQ